MGITSLGVTFILLFSLRSGSIVTNEGKPRCAFVFKLDLVLENWSIASILGAASWRSNSIFTLFYFRDLQFVYEGLCSLGPFVAAGEQIG